MCIAAVTAQYVRAHRSSLQLVLECTVLPLRNSDRYIQTTIHCKQQQTVLSDEAAAHTGGYTAAARLQEGALAFKAFIAQLATATAAAADATAAAAVVAATQPECASPTTRHNSTGDTATALLIR
jgi:hypothetical protein